MKNKSPNIRDFIETLEETNYHILSRNKPETPFDAKDVNCLFDNLGYKQNVKNRPYSGEGFASNMILVSIYI